MSASTTTILSAAFGMIASRVLTDVAQNVVGILSTDVLFSFVITDPIIIPRNKNIRDVLSTIKNMLEKTLIKHVLNASNEVIKDGHARRNGPDSAL